MIPVIINTCYGGFCFSEEAIEEYNKRKLQQDETFTPLVYKSNKRNQDLRFDPIMANVVMELGDSVGPQTSRLTVHQIEERYKDYVEIDEYNGFEHLEIRNATYILDEIDKAVKGTQPDDEKLWRIEDLLQQRDDK